MNLTTSVYEGMALLNSWRQEQREFVMQHVYTLGNYFHRRIVRPKSRGQFSPRHFSLVC